MSTTTNHENSPEGVRSPARIIVVTGGSRGLGHALVTQLAEAGHRVFALARSCGEPGRFATKADGTSLTIEYLECDVRDPVAVRRAFEQVGERCGRVDVLVNNAGTGEFVAVEKTSDELWQTTLATNLTGAFLCTRAVLPLMRASGGGLIVNVASIAAIRGVANLAAYSASKAGLVGLGRALAEELRPENIHVCNVIPGAIATDFWEHSGLAANWDRQQMLDVRIAAKMIADVILAYPQVVVEEIQLMPRVGLIRSNP
jgi:NAD(P)-dependent dehydrogenase (short-subunit alcohol dehydrogenase family)